MWVLMVSTRLGTCSARSGLGWLEVGLKNTEEMKRDMEEKKRRGRKGEEYSPAGGGEWGGTI